MYSPFWFRRHVNGDSQSVVRHSVTLYGLYLHQLFYQALRGRLVKKTDANCTLQKPTHYRNPHRVTRCRTTDIYWGCPCNEKSSKIKIHISIEISIDKLSDSLEESEHQSDLVHEMVFRVLYIVQVFQNSFKKDIGDLNNMFLQISLIKKIYI